MRNSRKASGEQILVTSSDTLLSSGYPLPAANVNAPERAQVPPTRSRQYTSGRVMNFSSRVLQHRRVPQEFHGQLRGPFGSAASSA